MNNIQIIAAILTLTDLVKIGYKDDIFIQDAMQTIRNLIEELDRITLQFDQRRFNEADFAGIATKSRLVARPHEADKRNQ